MEQRPMERQTTQGNAFGQGLDVPLGPRGRSPQDLNGMAHRHYTKWAVGDGSEDEFALPITVLRADDLKVFVAGLLLRPRERGTAHDYEIRGLTGGWAGDSNRVRFTVAPANGADICFDTVGG